MNATHDVKALYARLSRNRTENSQVQNKGLAMHPLLSANAIRAAVKHVLADPNQERVVAVAFVGKDPFRWLPTNLEGITLYCWPRPGSTNPRGIEDLINKKVNVHFVNDLHAKVFWGQTSGAVIGSANLSENGMEDNRLIEAAVQLPPGDHGIAEFLASIKSRAVSSSDRRFRTMFDDLSVEDVENSRTNARWSKEPRDSKSAPLRTFADWCDSSMPERWQVGWWSETGAPARDARGKFNARYPGEEPKFWLPGAKGEIVKDVATLGIKVNPNSWRIAMRPKPFWWYPEDFVVSEQKNAQDYPYHWYARVNLAAARDVPFDSSEQRFLDALTATVQGMQNDIERLRGPVRGKFLNALKKNYVKA